MMLQGHNVICAAETGNLSFIDPDNKKRHIKIVNIFLPIS